MRRKRLTGNQKLDLWNAHKGKCHRCGLPIDAVHGEKWEVGHVLALGTGGEDVISNMAPEHVHCNATDAREHTTPLAAKIKRIGKRHIGIKKPSRLAEQWAYFKRIRAERAALKDDGHE